MHVRARPIAEGEEVEISIEDHGERIPDAQRPRIFDPFFTTKPNGTGLGLAIVHRIIEAHAGRIQVTSQVGQGTRVQVVLPGTGS